MKILNIHGYQGNAANSAYEALRECGFDIISLQIDYDRTSPEYVMQLMNSQFTNNFCNAVVGTSLGGFYAALISAKNECPCVLINPCLMPFYHLPKLGYDGCIHDFIKLFGSLSELDRSCVSCIVGDADEVLGDHSFTEMLTRNSRFRRVPNGKHSGVSLPLKEYFGEVLRYYRDKLPQKELAQTTFPDLLD